MSTSTEVGIRINAVELELNKVQTLSTSLALQLIDEPSLGFRQTEFGALVLDKKATYQTQKRRNKCERTGNDTNNSTITYLTEQRHHKIPDKEVRVASAHPVEAEFVKMA